MSPEPPFPRAKAPPAKRDRRLWERECDVSSKRSAFVEHFYMHAGRNDFAKHLTC